METKEQARQIGEFFRRAFRRAGKVLSFLTFSAADERLRPRRILCVSVEKGAAGAALGGGFLSRVKIVKSGRFETGGNGYPGPSELVRAAKSVLGASGSGAPSGSGAIVALGGMEAALVIPSEWVIRRNAEFPSAVRHDIANAVSYDLDRLVPFDADRMLYDWRVIGEGGGKLTLQVSAVRLDKVKPFMALLGENGIPVSRIIHAVEDPALGRKIRAAGQSPSAAACGVFEALRFNAGPNLMSNGRREKTKVPVAGSALLVLLLLAVLSYRIITPLKVEAGKIDAMDRQISLERKKVGGVESVMRQIGVVNGEINTVKGFETDRSAALLAIKELTAVIPKSAWLTRLRFSGESVRIEGYAASASGLIPRLEKSGYFKKAEFASPTLRDAKTKSDHFVIKVQRADGGDPSGDGRPLPGQGKAKR